MQVAYAFLSQGAIVNENSFSILGGDIYSVSFASFPAAPPLLDLVVKLEFNADEVGIPLDIWADMVDAAHVRLVESAHQRFTPQEWPPEFQGLPAMTGFVIHFITPPFSQPGKYAFRLFVNHIEEKTVPLFALSLPVQQLNSSP